MTATVAVLLGVGWVIMVANDWRDSVIYRRTVAVLREKIETSDGLEAEAVALLDSKPRRGVGASS